SEAFPNVRLRRLHATSFWIGLRGNYLHLRAPAESDIAGLLADHLKRGVRRNRRAQRIDVASEIHDGAANQLIVCATYKRDVASACGLSLGGLGLRSHANCGANHRCNHNYSSDCHVVPPLFGRLPASLEIK